MSKSPHIPDDLFRLPRTREDAVASDQPYYFTNEPCKHGHIAARRTFNHTCQACSNARMSQRWKKGEAQRDADKEHRKELRQLFRGSDEVAARLDRIEQIGIEAVLAEEATESEARKVVEREKARRARLDTMADVGTEDYRAAEAAKRRENYHTNPEPHKARRREKTRRGIAGYRFERLRTPPWLTPNERAALKQIQAVRMPNEHVDHIVPRDDHPDLAGLHVPWNLQYLTAAKNSQRTRGRVNAFTPSPDEAAEYVANGMAVWKRDVAEDGVINWTKYPRPLTIPPMTIKFS